VSPVSHFFHRADLRVRLQVDDISAIFDVSERPYHSGSVSWGNSGGTYYIHRVDRTGYASIRERFENSRGGQTRRRRS
jgi:H3 lysine-79-specific histone-lysine N-methyltransferase